MALLDLSDVTNTLIELLKQSFETSPAWTAIMGTPNIVPEPPGRLVNEGLGIYLYHVQEKKEHSNFPINASGDTPVRFLPTALTLYYQVSANSPVTETTGSGAINEQLMMSVAIKAFHDYPFIDDQSTINGPFFFPPGIRGANNRFKITAVPVSYTDAVQNWTAGSSAIKLSAYYEVSTVFLEPEETTSYAGRVLSYGNYIFTGGTPVILSSQSIVVYRLPGELVNREIRVQPGQAAPGRSVTLYGSGFTADEIDLRILPPGSSDALLASPAWGVSVTAINKVSFTVQQTALRESDGSVVALLPGMYAAQVIATKIMQLPTGEIRRFKNSSNQFPFIITPNATVTGIAGTIATVAGYSFADPSIIDIYVGETKMKLKGGGAFGINEFRIINPTTLEINLPGPLSPGQSFPVRIVIGGAESPPAWIVVP